MKATAATPAPGRWPGRTPRSSGRPRGARPRRSGSAPAPSDALPDAEQDQADLSAEEDEGDDGHDGHQGQDEGVLGETLATGCRSMGRWPCAIGCRCCPCPDHLSCEPRAGRRPDHPIRPTPSIRWRRRCPESGVPPRRCCGSSRSGVVRRRARRRRRASRTRRRCAGRHRAAAPQAAASAAMSARPRRPPAMAAWRASLVSPGPSSSMTTVSRSVAARRSRRPSTRRHGARRCPGPGSRCAGRPRRRRPVARPRRPRCRW